MGEEFPPRIIILNTCDKFYYQRKIIPEGHGQEVSRQLRVWKEHEIDKSPFIGVYVKKQQQLFFGDAILLCLICKYNDPKNERYHYSSSENSMYSHMKSEHFIVSENSKDFTWESFKWYCSFINYTDEKLYLMTAKQISSGTWEIPAITFDLLNILGEHLNASSEYICNLCGQNYAVPPAREVILKHLESNCVAVGGLLRVMRPRYARYEHQLPQKS